MHIISSHSFKINFSCTVECQFDTSSDGSTVQLVLLLENLFIVDNTLFLWNSCKCFIVAFWIQKLFADSISDWCSFNTWFSDDDSTKLYSRNYISNFAWLYAFWLVSRADLMSESGLNGPQFRVWATLILNHWKQFKVHGEHGHPTKKRISWSWLDSLALYQVQQAGVLKLDCLNSIAVL